MDIHVIYIRYINIYIYIKRERDIYIYIYINRERERLAGQAAVHAQSADTGQPVPVRVEA